MNLTPVQKWLADLGDPAKPNKLLHVSGGPGKGALAWTLAQMLGKPICNASEFPWPITTDTIRVINAGLLCIEESGEWPDDLAFLVAAILTGTPYELKVGLGLPRKTYRTDFKIPIIVITHGRGGPLFTSGLDLAANSIEFPIETFARTPDVAYWKNALGVR